MIYLDNAATTWPKPTEVVDAVADFLTNHAANPGRSGHRLSIEASRTVYRTREALAVLLGVADPLSVAFTHNATHALNLAIHGLLGFGDHVVTTTMEHNSVARPLVAAQARGASVTRVPAHPDGWVDPQDILACLTPRTRMVIMTHASNVTGTIFPIGEIGSVTSQTDTLLCVDAAQTAGIVPIDMEAMGIDLLAVTGHKSLYGPSGTGALCVGSRAGAQIRPLLYGGTGSQSQLEVQPDFLPDRLEAGTLNAPGLAGLEAGIGFVQAHGVDVLRDHQVELVSALLAGMAEIPGVVLYGSKDPAQRTGVVSFNIEGMTCSQVGVELEDLADIAGRTGLHCAPQAHRQLGTFPQGTVRLSFGAFNNLEDVDDVLAALHRIAEVAGGDR